MKCNIDVIVIHDDIKKHSFLLTKLREDFETVRLIDDPDIGISYISEHFSDKIIVILDIDFGDGKNGYDVLEEIRKQTFLIEVIILSAKDLPGEEMINHIQKLFGMRAFDYIVRKPGFQEDIIASVIKAKIKIENSVSSAIDKWIEVQGRDRREKPYIVNHEGNEFTLNDLKNAINQRTAEGLELEKKIIMTAIKLMMNQNKSNKK